MTLRDNHWWPLLALVVLGMGCGARTGLRSEPRDAGPEPDVPVIPPADFPCHYGLSGEPVPLGAGEPATSSPSAHWIDGTLYVAFVNEPRAPFDPRIELCSADTELGLACRTRAPVTGHTRTPALLAPGEGGFALCWAVEFSGEPIITVLSLFDWDRELIEEHTLDERGARCRDLAWDGERYVALLGQSSGGGPGFVVRSLLPRGDSSPEHELEVASPLGASPPAALDAAGGISAVAWIVGRQLRVRGLSGTGFEDVEISTNADNAVSLSIRDDQIGVLWAESSMSGESVTLRFAMVDASSGVVHHRTEVTSFSGWLEALELEALWDGYMAGYWRYDGRLAALGVTPLHFNEDGTTRVGDERVLNEQAATGSWGLSLTDDGHVAFVAASYPEASSGVEQVHLLLLSCHR